MSTFGSTNLLLVNEKGRFPPNTQANSKGGNATEAEVEHRSLVILRSGKIIEQW